MEKSAKIYVAGHRGLVGSAIMRRLRAEGFENIVTRSHAELDLTNQEQVDAFFARDKAGSFQEIGFQLFKITGFAGVVACCLNTTRKVATSVKADYVVPLPTVNRSGDIFENVDGILRINANVCVLLFCKIVKLVHISSSPYL